MNASSKQIVLQQLQLLLFNDFVAQQGHDFTLINSGTRGRLTILGILPNEPNSEDTSGQGLSAPLLCEVNNIQQPKKYVACITPPTRSPRSDVQLQVRAARRSGTPPSPIPRGTGHRVQKYTQ